MSLTQDQQLAVTREGQDVCVIAGPGSGKTRVLTSRFEWLVRERQYSPRSILAITFTEKAATEIKRRLVRAFSTGQELRENIERAFVSTIHGFCMRLLKEHSIAAGLDPEFGLLDEVMSETLLAGAAACSLDRMAQDDPATYRRLLQASGCEDLPEALCKVYGAVRVTGSSMPDPAQAVGSAAGTIASFEALLRECAGTPPGPGAATAQREAWSRITAWASEVLQALPTPDPRVFALLAGFSSNLNTLKKGRERSLVKALRETIPQARGALLSGHYKAEYAIVCRALRLLDQTYRLDKRSRNVLDFDDLEEQAIALLETNAVIRGQIQGSFRQILMDEMQDTNPLQWRLVNLLRSPAAFFGVGDANQSIYGFRHADPAVFERYRKAVEISGAVDCLPENFRSRPEILEAVKAILGGCKGVQLEGLGAGGHFPPASDPPVEITITSGEGAEEAEPEWIARRIRELEGKLMVRDFKTEEHRPAQFGDFAVLVRTDAAVLPMKRAFEKFDVPYLIARGSKLYETREIRDLFAWLKLIANPHDEVAAAVVLRSPIAGIRDETLFRLKMAAWNMRGSLANAWDSLDPSQAADWNADDVERLLALRELLAQSRQDAPFVTPDRLLASVIDGFGYEEAISRQARANIRKFFARVRKIGRNQPMPIPELVEEVERLREFGREPEAPLEDASGATQLLTMHGAKGLEFPAVLCVSLHRGPNRRSPEVVYVPQEGLGMRWRCPAEGKAVSAPLHKDWSETEKAKEEAESNRLLYVAMTRARDFLGLSFVQKQRAEQWPKSIAAALGIDLDDASPEWRIEARSGFSFRLLNTGDAPPAWDGARRAEVEMDAPEFLAAPSVHDQWDDAAPVTALTTFGECARRYYLSQYLGWNGAAPAAERLEVESEGSDSELPSRRINAASLGTQAHKLLAGEAVPEAEPEAMELAARFHKSPLAGRLATATRVEREFDFLFELQGSAFSGQIDLWFEDAEGLVVVDYKTDSLDLSAIPGKAAVYVPQIGMYALALEKLTGRKPAEAYLHFLRPDVVESVPPAAAAQRAAALVGRFQQAQSRGEYPLTEGDHCFRCPHYRNLCPARPTSRRHPKTETPQVLLPFA